jgi:enoyl-CoA hydratase/carnithine racemase
VRIKVQHVTGREIWGMHLAGLAHEVLSGSVVVVEPDDAGFLSDPAGGNPFADLPAVFVSHAPCAFADLVIMPDELGLVVDVLDRTPLAAMALVLLLRGSEQRSLTEGLIAESTTYSMLQGGPEFQQWLRSRHNKPRLPEIGSAVTSEVHDRQFVITLNRPHVHNAFSRRMRDELSDALLQALSYGDSYDVVLQGAGPSFCSGGDLAEFGTFVSTADAHVTRLSRSPVRQLVGLAGRVTVRLHGACMGAGIELPAGAGRVIARRDAVIALPEIALGLVPGAGGTWTIPQRIGRQRTAWLALTGSSIDAQTAKEWGLVDEIDDDSPTTLHNP